MSATNRVQIDSVHSRAICDEIGERLRVILRDTAVGLPARLQILFDRLADQDLQMTPSIAPELEFWQPDAALSRVA